MSSVAILLGAYFLDRFSFCLNIFSVGCYDVCFLSTFPCNALFNDILSASEITGIYSPNAYRGFAREFIKDLERLRLLCC